MSRILDVGLEELSLLLHKMGELTFEAVSLSLGSFIEGKSVHRQVRELSDAVISLSDQVESKTFELIARYQPVASDLRTIRSYMKISNDFARYGRYAFDVSYICERLGGLCDCEDWMQEYIAEMSEKVLGMVRLSIDSLKDHDYSLAKTISEPEKQVDQLYLRYIDKIVELSHITNKCTVSSILVIRYLERIADHATYICESVVYLATGEKVSLG
jgi:phosphate transport system protein